MHGWDGRGNPLKDRTEVEALSLSLSLKLSVSPPQRRALFNISTSRSAPSIRCFDHFEFEISFAPDLGLTGFSDFGLA
jgi:hypothetical protein